MNQLRVELRAVMVPLVDGDEQIVAAFARRTMAVAGTVFGHSVQPYTKPPGSFMVRVEVDTSGDASSLIQGLLTAIEGTGWTIFGERDEVEAIWSPKEGSVPPLSPTITWAHIQAVPVAALPVARRIRST